jgi:hypothetical protein
MFRAFLSVLLSVGFLFVFPVVASDDAVNAKSCCDAFVGMKGEELFDHLHKLTGQNYKSLSYRDARMYMYGLADNIDGDVYALYSGLFIPGSNGIYKELSDENEDGVKQDFINCEHTWPQSKFNKNHPMVSDMHHLYPTLSRPNGARSSYPFGVAKGVAYSTSFGSVLGKNNLFEPADEVKGNVARAQFYFYTRYHNKSIFQQTNTNEYWNSKIAMFMEWHKMDPPDEKEMRRNNLIEKEQGNRNPFIDCPELVFQIGEEVFRK